MYVVQRIPERAGLEMKVLGRLYKTHKALVKDMREHPERFNENAEYNTIKMGEWMKVSYVKKAKVETVNIPVKEEK